MDGIDWINSQASRRPAVPVAILFMLGIASQSHAPDAPLIGLILLTLWAVFVPVIVLERPPGLGSLGRSRELVRGHAWSVFGIYVLLFLLIGVVSGLAAVIAFAASTAVGIVVSVVIAVLTVPLEAVAAAVIYFELLKLSKGPTPAFADVPGSSPVAPAPVPPATGASDAEKAFGSEDA